MSTDDLTIYLAWYHCMGNKLWETWCNSLSLSLCLFLSLFLLLPSLDHPTPGKGIYFLVLCFIPNAYLLAHALIDHINIKRLLAPRKTGVKICIQAWVNQRWTQGCITSGFKGFHSLYMSFHRPNWFWCPWAPAVWYNHFSFLNGNLYALCRQMLWFDSGIFTS